MDLHNADWVKSSKSAPQGEACVEVALNLGDRVAVRDSKNPAGDVIAVTPAQWRRFTANIRHHS